MILQNHVRNDFGKTDTPENTIKKIEAGFDRLGYDISYMPFQAAKHIHWSVIGVEARQQMLAQAGGLPDATFACVGGGSNAMGLFYPFLDDKSVRVIGVEAGGKGVNEKMQHCASLTGGRPGVLHGNRTYLMEDGDGQIRATLALGWQNIESRNIDGTNIHDLSEADFDREVVEPFVNSYLAAGKDGYDTLGRIGGDPARAVDTYIGYAQAFIDYAGLDRGGRLERLPWSEYSTRSVTGAGFTRVAPSPEY